MQKIYLVLASVITAVGLMSCDSGSDAAAKQDSVLLTEYVDSVSNLTPVYTQENWTAIDNAYQEKAMKSSATLEKLKAEDKEKAEASKVKYAELKATYAAKIKARDDAATMAAKNPDYRQVLRGSLFGEGNIGDDMKFGYVTGKNILGVYRNFVDKVSDNKSKYSREDWDEIKTLYEALDTRKNELEKDLAGSDNMKIAGLKIRFASIVATHRGGAKLQENSDSKE